MCDYKDGEKEAKEIMKKVFGISVEKYDDNSKEKMPDFKIDNNHYLEVTHTYHNFKFYSEIPIYQKKSSMKKQNKDLEKYTRERENFENLINQRAEIRGKLEDYIYVCSNINLEEQKRLVKEINSIDITKKKIIFDFLDFFDFHSEVKNEIKKLIERLTEIQKEMEKFNKFSLEMFGDDKLNPEKSHRNFRCNYPTEEFSIDNIEKEIKKKGKNIKEKYSLFLFVTDKEMALLVKSLQRNDFSFNQDFLNTIMKSIFANIYVCEWDFEHQSYDTISPKIIHFIHFKAENYIQWKYINFK